MFLFLRAREARSGIWLFKLLTFPADLRWRVLKVNRLDNHREDRKRWELTDGFFLIDGIYAIKNQKLKNYNLNLS